jgi:prepilin-type N-terminal cleavage/methylation domain-containing protein
MNIFQKNNDDNGFTLIEVLMVMAILSIGILAVMTMQITAAKSNSNARRITDSSNYMASEFESLMLEDYDTNYDDVNKVYPVSTVPEPPYAVSNAVTGGPIPNTRQVDITVGAGPLGNPLTITYYKADPF